MEYGKKQIRFLSALGFETVEKNQSGEKQNLLGLVYGCSKLVLGKNSTIHFISKFLV